MARSYLETGILTQVCFQCIAVAGLLEALDCSFLDLTDTLFGKIIFLTNLLNGNTIFTIQTEISIYDFRFAGTQ